jgi:RecA-family ATPase
MSLPDPTYIIDDFLPSDEVVAIAGPAKFGQKTWLALALAIVAATGKECFGLRPTNKNGVPVLFLELEGGAKAAAHRVNALTQAMGIELHNNDLLRKNLAFSHRDQIKLDSQTWIEHIKAVIEHDRTQLIFIDTFAQSHRGDENSMRDVQLVMDAVTELRSSDLRPSVVFLHHVRKPPTNAKDTSNVMDSMRGSSAFGAAIGHLIGIYKKNTDQRWLNIQIVSRNDEQRNFIGEWDIRQDKDKNPTSASFSYTETSSGGPLPDNMLTEYLGQFIPGQWYTLKQAKQALNSTGPEVRGILESLVSVGSLEQEPGKNRWRLVENVD